MLTRNKNEEEELGCKFGTKFYKGISTAKTSGVKFGPNRCFVTLFANPYLRGIDGQVTG